MALALEDMQAQDVYGQMNTMRKTDHQLLSPFYTAFFTKPVKYDSEKTGWGWKTESTSTTARPHLSLQLQDEAAAGA